MKNKAFTLAEVLIVVAINDVVACLTIPNIIQQHRKHVIETKLKRFYVDINDALVQAEVKYGSSQRWSLLTVKDDIEKYFLPFLDYKSAGFEENEPLPAGYSNAASYLIYFKNGSMVKIVGPNYLSADATEQHKGGFRDLYFYPNAGDYRKNKKSLKNFVFGWYRDASLGYQKRIDGTAESDTLDSNPLKCKDSQLKYWYDGTIKPYLYNQYICGNMKLEDVRANGTYIIMQNNWKIPDDYPFEY